MSEEFKYEDDLTYEVDEKMVEVIRERIPDVEII